MQILSILVMILFGDSIYNERERELRFAPDKVLRVLEFDSRELESVPGLRRGATCSSAVIVIQQCRSRARQPSRR